MDALSPTIRLYPNDDVVIARHHLAEGAQLPEEEALTMLDFIPEGHKVATRRIAAGAAVHPYNQIIGMAKEDIEPGQHVHAHNLQWPSSRASMPFRLTPSSPTTSQIRPPSWGSCGRTGSGRRATTSASSAA